MSEIKTYPISREQFKLKILHQMYKKGTLILNPEYQRSYVWERIRGKREKLIDSLLREFDIGTLFLRRVEKIIGGKPVTIYECLDGQQRLRAISDFIEGKYSTLVEITNELKEPKKFVDLEPAYQVRLTDCIVNPVIVNSNDEDVISDLFMRLQEGVPLRAPEKLNAIKGEMKKAIVHLSKTPFFKNTNISEYRFSHRYLSAQLVYLENKNKELGESWKFELRYKDLETMYRSYAEADKKKEVEKLVKIVRSNLNFLDKILDKEAGIIRNRGDAISVYLFASYLRAKYAIGDKKAKLCSFIRDFLAKVESATVSPWLDFKRNRRRATTSGEVVKENLEIMLQEFLKLVPNLELKDDKRIFDWGQRLAINSIQNGKCKACGKKISIKEAQFHHKIPWEKGGKTIVENGEMYCPKHHPK
jgi:hypothetical protein